MIGPRRFVIALLAAGAAGSADSTSVSATPSGYDNVGHERCSEIRLWSANNSSESGSQRLHLSLFDPLINISR